MATITTTRVFFYVLMMISFTVLCSAKIYKVGDFDGWRAKDDAYYAWTEHKEFHVGDSLVFEYDKNFNDVIQVSSALEYEFCDFSSPKAIYKTGQDIMSLTEPGFYYFISSNQTQCVSGQKLDILVIHDPQRPITSPSPTQSKILPFGKIYKVGDSKGWSVNVESDYYNKWSEERQFHVGDMLLFEYGNELSQVLEISGNLEFISCDPTSPIAGYETGHDLVRLTEPGVHYFVSFKTNYCEAGLKLQVMVQPQAKDVIISNIPKKTEFSPTNRLKKWLQSFTHH